MTNPGLRASDADRQHVVAALERHTAAGRLTLDEFGDRVARALAAATHGELSEIVGDLPVEPVVVASATVPDARQLAVAFLLAMLVLVVIGAVLTLAR